MSNFSTKKTISTSILIVILSFLCACTGIKSVSKIELFNYYDSKKNVLSGNLDGRLSVNKTAYVYFQYEHTFNQVSINMNVNRFTNGKYEVQSGTNVTVKPEDKKVVIPITINKAGVYEISFFLETPEKPLCSKEFIVE